MELIYRSLPMDYELYIMSCLHYGALNCHREGIREVIGEVQGKKNRFVVNIGDSIDAVLPNDKRYASCSMDIRANLLTPQQQADACVSDFACIRERVLAWGHGNHEFTIVNTLDVGRYIAEKLNIPYGCATYKLCATDKKGRLMHKVFLAHGRGQLPKGAKDPIQRKANQEAWVRRKLEETGFGDCVLMVMGHIHKMIPIAPTTTDHLYLTDNGTQIKQHYRVLTPQDAEYIPPDSRWYGSTGSFLKLYSPPGSYAIGYGEMAMYGPTELGCLKATIQGGQVVNLEKVVV